MADETTTEQTTDSETEQTTETVDADVTEVPTEAIPGQSWRGPVEVRGGGHVHYDGATFNWSNDDD